MTYVIAPPRQAAMAISNSHLLFPVRRIYCVGRNYNDHVIEMGGTPGRETPFFFQKPPDALVLDGKFAYPSCSENVHHEVELVVALKSGGTNIAAEDASQHIFGYAVGIDMTRRDLQSAAKQSGKPWEVAKAFDGSAPVGEITPVEESGHPTNAVISLSVNGAMRQKSNIAAMIWSVPEILAELSRLFELRAGDIVFTGTPQGVGPVQVGDMINAGIEGLAELSLQVCKPS